MLLPCYQTNLIEAGCDEAGRGCLAGPVFAAAVILPQNFGHPVLTDSKQLTHKERLELRIEIERDAIAWAVAQVDHIEIDRINILNASLLAIHLALEQLKTIPQFILIDGNRFKNYRDVPHQCIIEGDSKYFSIAAASVLAKTYRDDFMCRLDLEYPNYSWVSNKGYATPGHRTAVLTHGLSPYHRRSFRIKEPQPELFV